MSLIAAGIGAAAAGLSSWLGSRSNKSQVNSANNANKELAAQQNEYNLQLQDREFNFNREQNEYVYAQNLAQWQRENEYNSPSAQMQRLIEAGLNPNLVYGSGSATQSSASSPTMTAAQYSSPRAERATVNPARGYVNNIDPFQAISISNQLGIQAAQKDQINAQAEYVRAQTDNERLRNHQIDLDLQYNRSSFTPRLSGIESDAAIKKQLIRQNDLRYDFDRRMNELNIDKGSIQYELIKQQLQNLRTSDDLNRLKTTLLKMGVSDRDNIIFRLGARILAESLDIY